MRRNLLGTGYPVDRLVFVKGKVEETIPGTLPERIAVLRLDTDWFESTYHEFIHLYPRLVRGGVLIVDDYGHWKGARAATDRYFAANGIELICRPLSIFTQGGCNKTIGPGCFSSHERRSNRILGSGAKPGERVREQVSREIDGSEERSPKPRLPVRKLLAEIVKTRLIAVATRRSPVAMGRSDTISRPAPSTDDVAHTEYSERNSCRLPHVVESTAEP